MEFKEDKNKLTRDEALRKMGKYALLTAVGTFTVLNPLKAQTISSPPDPSGGPFD
tara:strand:+ start:620 stop:784 length:165 start_codon:yes stop_codon:yes gene_type:complete